MIKSGEKHRLPSACYLWCQVSKDSEDEISTCGKTQPCLARRELSDIDEADKRPPDGLGISMSMQLRTQPQGPGRVGRRKGSVENRVVARGLNCLPALSEQLPTTETPRVQRPREHTGISHVTRASLSRIRVGLKWTATGKMSLNA